MYSTHCGVTVPAVVRLLEISKFTVLGFLPCTTDVPVFPQRGSVYALEQRVFFLSFIFLDPPCSVNQQGYLMRHVILQHACMVLRREITCFCHMSLDWVRVIPIPTPQPFTIIIIIMVMVINFGIILNIFNIQNLCLCHGCFKKPQITIKMLIYICCITHFFSKCVFYWHRKSGFGFLILCCQV